MDMIFGKLGWDSIPTEPIVLVTMVMMALGGIAVVAVLPTLKMGLLVERMVHISRP
jgi:cytochrome o ubiquinol oxidase subunit 1